MLLFLRGLFFGQNKRRNLLVLWWPQALVFGVCGFVVFEERVFVLLASLWRHTMVLCLFGRPLLGPSQSRNFGVSWPQAMVFCFFNVPLNVL